MNTSLLESVHTLPLEKRVLGPILRARAEREGERVYMRFGERAWSFAATERIARNVARAFRDAGLAKSERVGLFLPNLPEFILSWFGCNLAGGATVPINPTYTAHLLDYVLGDSDVRGLVTTPALLEVVAALPAERLARLRFIILAGGENGVQVGAGAPRTLGFDAIAAGDGVGLPDPEIALDFRDLHSIMYTSGTTGPSKGAMVPNGHYFSASCTFLRAVNLQRDDILFTPLPLFHGVASRLGALPSFMVGAEYVLAPRFSASQFWGQVTACRATVAHTIFTLPVMLKAQPPGEYDRAHRVRVMYNSGLDPEFESRFGVRLIEAYGLTEVGLSHYSPYSERRPGSCGKTHEDWESRLVDERGMEVPVGEVGLMLLRPRLPSIMMDGYVNKPLETLRMFKDLWLQTGDYLRRDADGYHYFVSRARERIRRRGENISPAEIEAIAGGHPAVADCAALAHPAREGEDDVRLVVVRKPGHPLAALQLMDWLKERTPHFMMPRYVEFLPTDLPRNPAGKVEKYKLLDAGLAADVWDREAHGYVIRRKPV